VRDAPTHVKIEVGIIQARTLKVERAMQPLSIVHAQTRACFPSLADAFATLALLSPIFGALALLDAFFMLRRALMLGVALLRVLMIRSASFLLRGAPLFSRPLVTRGCSCSVARWCSCRCGSARWTGGPW
jgi:hypothetical protein